MSPKDTETCIKYFMSKLSPADLEELDGQLDGGAEPEPMASDHRLPADMQGRWLAMDAKTRNAVRKSWTDRSEARSGAIKGFAERFPEAAKIKVRYMSAHTALAEVTAILQNAGIAPDDIVKVNGLVHGKPDLSAWLLVPHSDRVRFLAEHGQQAALTRRNAGGPPR